MDDFLSESVPKSEPTIPIVLAPGESDPRLKQLSYSSNLTKHECPRKFQLYKLNAEVRDPKEENVDETVTFGFGHAVGEGIQSLTAGASLETVMFQTFLKWKGDIFYTDVKRNKSLWLAIFAIQKFQYLRASGFLENYELVYHNSRPAVELGFRIHLPKGYKYRGFVDLVLRNTKTGEVVVLEIKTSSGNVIHNSYKNSAQAIGYSIVLDWLFPELSSYQVLYLVYKTKEYEYEPVLYTKTYLQRALWIQELLLEVETQELYEKVGVYPMFGESCISKFYRECEYLHICTLPTERITKPLTQKILDTLAEEKYDVEVSIEDLITAQLKKEQEIIEVSTKPVYIQGNDDVIV